MHTITESSRICLHFELALEDGQVVDTNFDRAPVEFVYGDGNLLASFESELLGLSAGDERSFIMPPEKAFGVRNPNNIQRFARSQFSIDIEEGMIVSFADVGKNELPGLIAKIDDKEVEVDFNHPLAGRTLSFMVKIVAIEEV